MQEVVLNFPLRNFFIIPFSYPVCVHFDYHQILAMLTSVCQNILRHVCYLCVSVYPVIQVPAPPWSEVPGRNLCCRVLRHALSVEDFRMKQAGLCAYLEVQVYSWKVLNCSCASHKSIFLIQIVGCTLPLVCPLSGRGGTEGRSAALVACKTWTQKWNSVCQIQLLLLRTNCGRIDILHMQERREIIY